MWRQYEASKQREQEKGELVRIGSAYAQPTARFESFLGSALNNGPHFEAMCLTARVKGRALMKRQVPRADHQNLIDEIGSLGILRQQRTESA